MKALNLINFEIPPLRSSDSVGQALTIMDEFKCSTLPVLAEGEFEGTLSEDLLQNFLDDQSISTIPKKDTDLFLLQDATIIQVVDFLLEKELEVLAIKNDEGKYQGSVFAADAFKELAQTLYSGKGAVVELKLNRKDYSLSEISRLVENEGVSILQLAVLKGDVVEEDQDYTVLLKFNKEEVSQALSSLKRFGYTVSTHNVEIDLNDLDRDRYEMLMKYLNV